MRISHKKSVKRLNVDPQDLGTTGIKIIMSDTMKNIAPKGLWMGLLLPLLLSTPLPAVAEPILNGMAIHSEFNKERFIGALFVERPDTSADSVLQSNQARRMELRILSRTTPRQLTQLWIEGMAINNKPELLSREAENMVVFSNQIQSSLQPGDALEISQAPGQGTTFSVNNITIGHLPSDEFFDMLLSTWVGNIPLSSDFRDALLQAGKVDLDLQQRFYATLPAAGREQVISQWLQPQTTETASTKAPAAPAQPVAALTPTSFTPKVAAPTIAAHQPAIETAPAKPVAVKPVASIQEPAKPVTAAVTPTVASTAAADIEDTEADEDETGPALTVSNLLDRQKYLTSLLQRTYQFIHYPDRALERKLEGSIRLQIKLDNEGNVLDIAALEESPHNLLNREAIRAAKRASPYPAVPDALGKTGFTFTLPITFRLPN